ncbi:hypothetical protein J3A83DRAFT_4535847 [Scleroderma citrinum]
MSADDVTNLDVDAAIRVQVTPSQASYFAGEEFTVTITFTNTRTPESSKPRNTHRRGAHSISSAPLARPPTSPSIPRPTALPTSITRTPSNGCDVPVRKNLLGQGSNATKGSQDMKGILEQKRQNLLEKLRSLSVDIPAREAYNEFSDVAGDFQLPPHHLHARKHSVLDGQAQLSEVPALASSSTPTFSIALDPIAESPVSPYLGSPSPRSPPLNDPLKPTPLKRESQLFPRSTQGKSPHLNLGHGPRLRLHRGLLGAVSITPLPGASMSQEHAKTLNGLRARLLKRPIVGGGSMDITSRQRVQERKRSHSRASSLTSGLLSLLSPSSSSVPSSPIQSSPPPWKTGNPRSPTAASSPSSALMNGGPQEDIDAEMPLPTFEVQPTMLAVDLSLTPGESRTLQSAKRTSDPIPGPSTSAPADAPAPQLLVLRERRHSAPLLSRTRARTRSRLTMNGDPPKEFIHEAKSSLHYPPKMALASQSMNVRLQGWKKRRKIGLCTPLKVRVEAPPELPPIQDKSEGGSDQEGEKDGHKPVASLQDCQPDLGREHDSDSVCDSSQDHGLRPRFGAEDRSLEKQMQHIDLREQLPTPSSSPTPSSPHETSGPLVRIHAATEHELCGGMICESDGGLDIDGGRGKRGSGWFGDDTPESISISTLFAIFTSLALLTIIRLVVLGTSTGSMQPDFEPISTFSAVLVFSTINVDGNDYHPDNPQVDNT